MILLSFLLIVLRVFFFICHCSKTLTIQQLIKLLYAISSRKFFQINLYIFFSAAVKVQKVYGIIFSSPYSMMSDIMALIPYDDASHAGTISLVLS